LRPASSLAIERIIDSTAALVALFGANRSVARQHP